MPNFILKTSDDVKRKITEGGGGCRKKSQEGDRGASLEVFRILEFLSINGSSLF